MVTTRDEILIQRCVDGELSADERRELLTRIEQRPDGWKTLACSFMEDQLFAGAATDASGGSRSSLPILRPNVPVRNPGRSWFSHPATSVVLLLCVAFLAGLLANGGINNPPTANVAANDTTPDDESMMSDRPSTGSTMPAALVSDKPDYSVRFEADGMSSRDLPIYEDSATFLSQFTEYQRENGMRHGGSKEPSGSQIHFLRIRLNDGRTIVVPYERTVPSFQ